MPDERDPVHFNFAQGPGGTVAFNAVFEGGFDKNKAVHRFAMNLMRYLESEAMSKSFQVVNGEEVVPSTLPERTLYDA